MAAELLKTAGISEHFIAAAAAATDAAAGNEADERCETEPKAVKLWVEKTKQ